MHVYTVLNLGLAVIMGYAFLKKEEANPKVADWLRFFTGAIMLSLTFFVFDGLITIIEFASSIGLLVGTILLAHGGIKLGWLVFGIAHLLAAYLGYEKEQQYFADLQIASAIVAAIGILKCQKRTP